MKKPAITSLLILSLILVLVTSVSAGVPAAGTTVADPETADSVAPSGNAIDVVLAPDAVGTNPDLLPGCGIKLVLILDASGSINTTEQGLVRAASTAFLNALNNTGSQVAIVEFATNANTPVGYTPVTSTNITNVFTPYLNNTYPNSGVLSNTTNWEAAFLQANALPTAPDMVVFVTDGEPNTYHVPGVSTTLANALAAAETAANPTKLASGAGGPWGANAGNGGFGSHIFGVGVGMTDGGLTNMYRVLDSGVAPNHVNLAYSAGPPSNFPQADYTRTADFSALQADLTAIVSELCSSSLTVTKLADNDGRGGAYYLPQAGFTFTGHVVPSAGTYTWLSPSTVVPTDDRSGVSGADGKVFFQWRNSDLGATANITIAETHQADFVFNDVACTVGTVPQTVTQAETFTVNGIARQGFGACTVRNRRLLDFGDAPDSYGTLLADNGARHAACSVTPIFIGVAPDYEADGQPALPGDPATGDDFNDTNDEGGLSSGITLPTTWAPGTRSFGIDANTAACLNVWMDVQKDGSFTQAGDWLVNNQPVALGANSVNFTAPAGLVTATQNEYYLRFRITPQDANGGCGGATAYGGTASSVGVATCGEVTDLQVSLSPLEVTSVRLVGLKAVPALGATMPLAAIGFALLTGFALARRQRR